jgi:hypothetical protein
MFGVGTLFGPKLFGNFGRKSQPQIVQSGYGGSYDRNFVPKSGVKYVFVFAGSPKFINYEDFN